MKAYLLLLLFLPVFGAISQEIEHKHSPLYALTENKGQWPGEVLFQSRSQGQNIWIIQHGFQYDIRKVNHKHTDQEAKTAEAHGPQQARVFAEFTGSSEVTSITKSFPTSHYYNFFLGNDRSRWKSEVRGFSEVILHDFYPLVDMKLTDKDGEFKYELYCKPGTDFTSIRFELKGASSVVVNEFGQLIVRTPLGDIVEKQPVAYQLFNGALKEIECKFVVEGTTVSWKLGRFDPEAIVIIDPVLVFSTYSGSIADNFGMTATYGYDGTAYSGGTIFGNQYALTVPSYIDTLHFDGLSGDYGISDVVVSKYTADGTNMIWATYLGGGDDHQGTETANSMICDKNNNLYVFGATSSLDFPTVNPVQANHAGGKPAFFYQNGIQFGTVGTDIYISKISSDGQTLMGSTYMGGAENDGINYAVSSGTYSSLSSYDSLALNYGDQSRGEIMLDNNGDCIVASCTRSPLFPNLNPFQPTFGGQQDGLVFKLSGDLSTKLWSSFYGGSDKDACYSVKVDSSDNIVFAGGTASPNLPLTAGSAGVNYKGGKVDGFVAKLTPDGSTLTRSAYIGTTGSDQAYFVEINRNDEIYLYGQSRSGTFPTVNATGNLNSGQFIAKLSPNLSTITNSFTFGSGNGTVDISPSAFLVDVCGNMYVSGWGGSVLNGTPALGPMPVTPDALYPTSPNGRDFYLAVFGRQFDGLIYGTYFGSANAKEHVDGGTSRFDKYGVVYQSVCGGCAGDQTQAVTTPGAWCRVNQSDNCNNLVFKFDFELIPDAEFTADNVVGCAPFTIQLENNSKPSDSYKWDFGNGQTSTTNYEPEITYTAAGTYVVTLVVTDSICLLTDTARITITVLPSLPVIMNSDIVLCFPEEVTFAADGGGLLDNFVWSDTPDFADTLNTNFADSSYTFTPTGTTTLYLSASDGSCTTIDSMTVYIVDGSIVLSAEDSICAGTQTLITANIEIPGVIFDYTWAPASIISPTAIDNQVNASPLTPTWVVVSANGGAGCFDQDSIFINVGNVTGSVIASANPDVVVPGSTSTLSASPSGYSYQWFPPTGLSNPNAQTTTATVEETTTYTVSVTDGICTKSDDVQLKVYVIACDERYVFVPNAFSPNGDGENEVLFVRSAVATEIEFRIFDRWGELIFESYSVNNGWDGTFRGKLVDPDVYDYYLKAICINGEEQIIKGNITLIR